MTKLRELEAQFLRYERRELGLPTDSPRASHVVHVYVHTLAEADGIFFLCPKCFAANGGKVGTHGVLCWFEDRVPDDVVPGPGRWKPTGTGYDDLSFVPGKHSNSVLLLGDGCGWHGFVTNGSAE